MIRSRLFVAAAWLAGIAAGVYALFHVGPQMQCAADPTCAWDGNRWWHTPLLLAIAVGPGIAATIVRRRALRRAG